MCALETHPRSRVRPSITRRNCITSLCNSFQHPEAAVLAVRQGALLSLVNAAHDDRLDEDHPLVAHSIYNCSCHEKAREMMMGPQALGDSEPNPALHPHLRQLDRQAPFMLPALLKVCG